MRILVNYDKAEQAYLSILQFHLRQRNMEAIATSSTLEIGELLGKAQAAKCDGIFLCNSSTLAKCVPGKSPSLDDYRGSRLNFSVPTIVGNSLLHTHSTDHGAWLLGIDLDKFKTCRVPAQEFYFEVLESKEQQDYAIGWLSLCVLIAYDIETITIGGTSKKEKEEGDWSEKMPLAGDTLISCVSWTGLHHNGEIKSFVLPFIDFGIPHWNTDSEWEQAIVTMRAINHTMVPKGMHNGMYDVTHSLCVGAEPRHWTLDTMALQHSQYQSLPKTLDFTASIYLYDYIQWKNESNEASKSKDIHRYWAYNARDTFSTLRILIQQLKTLPPYAFKNYALQFPNVYPSLYCNFEGESIDINKRNELRKAANERLLANLSQLRILVADEEFNPGSWQQVAYIIYDLFGASDPKIGWKKDPKTKKKTKVTRGTDEKNMRAVGSQHPLLLRLTSAIISYREDRKAIGTYFDFSLKNGRLFYALNPFGTDTARMACSASSWWCGTQVQNIPPYAKAMCVADPGWEIIEADNSQSEARCTGYLAKEWNLVSALETPGKDFYKSLGTLFFLMPYGDVTKEFRNLVLKKIVHGTNYMMGPDTFIENAGLENILLAAAILNVRLNLGKKDEIRGFAAFLLAKYHEPFPRIREWYQEVKNEIRTTHMLHSPLGYTRYFFGDIDKKYQIFASAVAHGPQNLSVMIVNKGLWKAWEITKASKGEVRLKAQIHDSIKTQVRTEAKDIYIPQLLAGMNNPVTVNGRVLSIPVDYKYGLSWDEKSMTEVKGKL